MFFNPPTTESKRPSLPVETPVSSWNVIVYRKTEPIHSFHSYDISQTQYLQQGYASFYIQLQQSADPSSTNSSVLYLRYLAQSQRNSVDTSILPFTISLLDDLKLSPETSPSLSAMGTQASRFYNVEQQSVRSNEQSEYPTAFLFRAKAFLGILVLNNVTNSTNAAAIIRAYMIFVTEETPIGRLFDANIIRILQIAAVPLRDCQEDETYVSGIKKLFQGGCFYYSKYSKPESNYNKHYFDKPYDITLCAQRMEQGHDSDIRFFWNRGLSLPLLKYNIDIRYWIPKVMCGGIENFRSQNDDIDLWLISRLSCERAGTRFNVRGVNDDGAVANFVETEQIVLIPQQHSYSSFIIVRGSIPIFWHQPRFQSKSKNKTLLCLRHFKHLYRQYGRLLVINLVERRDHEKRIGNEYKSLFDLLVKTSRQTQNSQQSSMNHLNEQDFIWFDYHEQSRTIKNFSAEQFVQKLFIENVQYPIKERLHQQGFFTWMNGSKYSTQKGVFRMNCIDCLDRTNNVQLAIGSNVLSMQLQALRKQCNSYYILDGLRGIWVKNGDHISRIYTGTGALGQKSKAKDIQRSVGRAIQNSLRDDDKQQSVQTLIYSYSKDSYLHERAVAALFTPYVISDGFILNELFKIRRNYTRKEKFRISIGTWNINGDKNPALGHQYPSILDAWLFHGPDNMSTNLRKPNAIPTNGYVASDYEKSSPDIVAIGFQEICDLTASNIVSKSSSNANRWVKNVEDYFKKTYQDTEYILLGMDQLVGVCLAIFIRRDLAPYVKNVGIDTVKTGMGGTLGNKGCVAIRLVLHSTSICFICAHFTAGQNEYSERNKDYKLMMEKLSFQPPSRAIWHDHIFFLGDFNYRLTIPRAQVEYFVRNGSYKELLEYDQLKKELQEKRVFRDFEEGEIRFPPTYKYDIGSDEYDTSEKARTPSYTDRVLWRTTCPNIQIKQLYYGRAEVKTSDHRPVSSIFDADVEICDEKRLYEEYVQLYRRLAPSNALIRYDMVANSIQTKQQIIDEFDLYIKKRYGSDISIVDRFFASNQRYLSLYLFFENGEQVRRVLEPREDQLQSGIYFKKTLIDLNEDVALAERLILLFTDVNQTMDPETIHYDLGAYQQPARESLSTNQDIPVTSAVAGDELISASGNDADENYQDNNTTELISFHADHQSLSSSSSSNNLQSQSIDPLFNESCFDPFHFSSHPASNTTKTNNDNLFSFDHPKPSVGSNFYIDPFDIAELPSRQDDSKLNLFSQQLTNSTHYDTDNHRSKFYYQAPPQFIPTRPPPPVPAIAPNASAPIPFHDVQGLLTLKNLSLNANNNTNNNNEQISDLVDLGDPGSPPPSPKFDPFG
ncbi:unnamed protein product [Rotaria magnacalcarata]|uniref:phosphoinositide 5-phosphatase n=1 Tax=Rotaria magnacalcarata TaxID=392030 RepID=A0A816ZC55_9BILA|nr:unnamed protein product [Rotaria magnacalcarata]CAF2206117.1 unnamed protein product [Rotaria magnacalcarata]